VLVFPISLGERHPPEGQSRVALPSIAENHRPHFPHHFPP
jgi:hypothetical protein